MARLRDIRKNRKPTQIENTGLYVKNVPLSEMEKVQDRISEIKEANENCTDEEAFLFALFQDFVVDQDGAPFEGIEAPEDLKEELDIEAMKATIRYFGFDRMRLKNG